MAPMLCFRKSKKRNANDYGTTGRNGKEKKSMGTNGICEDGLTLQYVTKRIIAITSPSNSADNLYKESLGKVVKQLKTDHFDRYKIWNLSRHRRDLLRCGPIVDIGWPIQLAPPLDRLCMMCKQWEQWLSSHPSNVIVIHSKGDSSRIAIAISSYMHYNVICANDDSIEDRFSMQRFADKVIGIHGQPSHKRYLTYFSNLLSGKTRVNPTAVYLQKIVVHRLSHREVFFKIYEKMKPVHSTTTVGTKDTTKIEIEGELKLRGDILLKCIEIKNGVRHPLFFCQFNTCALELIGKTPSLNFYKEELDLIFCDPEIDNQSNLEVHFTIDPPKTSNRKKSITEVSRTDSYEDFGVAEDESIDQLCGSSVEYSIIQKGVPSGTCTSEDSGVSVESPVRDDRMGPPPVPPKPRPNSSMGESITDTSQGEYVERRGVLPASVKPQRPVSPKDVPHENGEITKGRSTPSIEPDLVGKDRYDKASRCFSYVSAKDLNKAFQQPKKPSSQRAAEVKTVEESIDNVNAEELSRAGEMAKSATDLMRRPETPTWNEEIDRAKQIAGSTPFLDRSFGGSTSDIFRIPEKPKWEEEIEEARKRALKDADPYGNRSGLERSQSVAAERYREEDIEKPMVYDQSRRTLRATTPGEISIGGVSTGTNGTMKRRTNYGSYRMLDDENYNSDMDDLCNPEFYLNFNSQNATRPQAPKSEQLPRRQFRPVEPLSEQDDFPPHVQPNASCLDVSKTNDRDVWRQRNCRSVASIPSKDRKLFSNDGYDAVQQAAAPDDWLSTKLRKLKSKRDMDPDLVRRRTQEKMLLEELKNSSGDKEDRKEKEFTTEGMGTRSNADALEAYKREEERLRNTYSPFEEMPRRGRGVRGKPPTPPPRDRSQSPNRDIPSRINTPSVDTYKSERVQQQSIPFQNGHSNHAKETNIDDDFSDFSHLSNIVRNNNASSTPLPPPHKERPILKRSSFGTADREPRAQTTQSQYQSQTLRERTETPSNYYNTQDRFGSDTLSRAQTPSGQYYSGQERVAAAIARAETPTRQFYNTQERAPSTIGRSSTPQFPTNRGETPLPYHPLLYNQNTQSRVELRDREPHHSHTMNHRSVSPRPQYNQGHTTSRRSSLNSVDTSEIITHHPIFVKDTSKYWYKPTISREQAINMLRDKTPGTFVVRDSNSFPGAFGLALKVATPPPGVQPGDGTELVRHFLIEPSPKGVKLKGCNNEPVFGSLSALVYQHSITPLALPAKLLLPQFDPAVTPEHVSAAQALLEQGAACNVAYIGSIDCESLTGDACVRRCVANALEDYTMGYLNPVSVHFKVSSQGVTLTDNTRKLFFRRHFPVQSVIFAGEDPDKRRWDNTVVTGFTNGCVETANLFAVVARKANTMDNQCHIFAEFEPEQPATAVLNFINKVLLGQRRN